MLGSWTLRSLAVLGLVLPFLLAVATQYSTQIIPDFDDYDWEGPDDDSSGEEKIHVVRTGGGSRPVATFGFAGPASGSARLPGRTSDKSRRDDHVPRVTSRPHRNAELFRGPPIPL